MSLNFDLKQIKLTNHRKTYRGETFTETLVRLPMLTYILVGILALCSWYYYYLNNLTLAYNDARSHLNIARRVIDSLHPGFAQIGSVWLPLQHILELPTIWNDMMYRSGLSGSLISIISFIGSTVFLGKIARVLKLDYKSSLVAMLIFALNPNMLFMQSTPMTESLMVFTSLGAIYFLTRWTRYNAIGDLLKCGIFTFAAVLTRYDGWFLFAFESLAVPIISLIQYDRKKAEANFILFSLLGLFGILLWVGWNALIFGNPLYFLNGPFSAKAQQDILLKEGRLFTVHNLPLSVETYFLAVIDNTSMILTALAGTGYFAILLSKMKLTMKIAISMILVPVFFNIISLFLGESVIHLPELPPHLWFNIRYGLMALPAVALGAAVLVNKRIVGTIVVISIILMQYYLMFATNNIITIQDGVRGSSGYFLDDVGSWVHNNAGSGYILVASSSHDALIFIAGLPLNHFITEGSGKYWSDALVHPTKYARFVIMHEGDLVYDKLHNNPEFFKNYKLVFQGEFANVYELTNNQSNVVQVPELSYQQP